MSTSGAPRSCSRREARSRRGGVALRAVQVCAPAPVGAPARRRRAAERAAWGRRKARRAPTASMRSSLSSGVRCAGRAARRRRVSLRRASHHFSSPRSCARRGATRARSTACSSRCSRSIRVATCGRRRCSASPRCAPIATAALSTSASPPYASQRCSASPWKGRATRRAPPRAPPRALARAAPSTSRSSF
jgi:hypothetical protein